MQLPKTDVILGTCAVVLALLAIALWIPNDTMSGYILSQRGRVSIGDAMAPGLAFGLMILAGGLILRDARRGDSETGFSLQNLLFLMLLFAVCFLAFLLMRWVGPLLVALAGPDGDVGYRELRDTFPWKHAGFVTGGIFLVTGLVSLIERRLSLRALLVGGLAVAGLIAVFDLPFDDLLLPPNGDV